MTRDEMAYVYAGLIFITDFPFPILNQIIIKKWSRIGLTYIKKKARKIAEELNQMEKEQALMSNTSTPKE